MCCLQLRSQATFQAAPQLFALISIQFTCTALQNTCFFAVGLSISPLPPRDKGGLSSKEDRHGYQQPTKSAWSQVNNSSDLGGSQNKITSYLIPSMGIWLVGRTLNMARQKYLHCTQENLACTQKNNPTVNTLTHKGKFARVNSSKVVAASSNQLPACHPFTRVTCLSCPSFHCLIPVLGYQYEIPLEKSYASRLHLG